MRSLGDMCVCVRVRVKSSRKMCVCEGVRSLGKRVCV